MFFSQSLGDVALVRHDSLCSKVSINIIKKSTPQTNNLSERENTSKTNSEIALSETRLLKILNQEDFDLSYDYNFEPYKTNSLNNKLQNIRTKLVLCKDLSQLRVLII